jgi:diguanylate cyclase (GGDEF)-like protein
MSTVRDQTRTYARLRSSKVGAAGASVALAALLIGLSAGIAAWAVETGILSHARAGRTSQIERTLGDVRGLLSSRDREASRQAAQLAARPTVQGAFVRRDAAPLVELSASHPNVGFILWDGRTVGRAALAPRGSSLSIYSHGRLAGRVIVSVEPDDALLRAAREASLRVHLFYTLGGRVAAASPAVGSRSPASLLQDTVSDVSVVGGGARGAGKVFGYTPNPRIPLRAIWPILLALAAAALSFRILGRREATRRAEPPPNPVRDAVALVGETLAATHNPEALLPVILQAAVEATDAVGGSITALDAVLATRGTTPADAVDVIEVPLEVAQGRAAVMRLYSGTTSGFGPAANDAAAWIAAQALIALENARLHGQVQRQAVTDELTGLANRRRFLSQLEAEVTRSRRNGSPLGIILADLDDFKRVNDTYGHEVGDEALRSFAKILQGTVRDVDLPVRLGGEEFAVLVPDTDLEGAALLAERIRQELEASRPDHSGRRFQLTASFGVSCFPSAATAEDLLTDADRRLYEAKHRGKNIVIASSDRGTMPAG